MKMSAEHFAELQAGLADVTRDNPDAWTDYKARGLSETRYRWDAFWCANEGALPAGFVNTLYAYLNDANIDAALRKALPL